MNDLNELRDEIYDDAVKHGLWDDEYCKKMFRDCDFVKDSGFLCAFKIAKNVKEMKQVSAALRIFMENQELLCSVLVEDHFREELADVIITALSAAGYLGIDIDKAVREKMKINRGREWRHGK